MSLPVFLDKDKNPLTVGDSVDWAGQKLVIQKLSVGDYIGTTFFGEMEVVVLRDKEGNFSTAPPHFLTGE